MDLHLNMLYYVNGLLGVRPLNLNQFSDQVPVENTLFIKDCELQTSRLCA